jgi:hypothetical protein
VLNQGINGNLVSSFDGTASHKAGSSSISFTTGKKYFEFTSVSLLNNIVLDDGGNGDWAITGDGRLYIGGNVVDSDFVNWTDGDLIGLALDADSDTFDVFVNGTLQNSYDASGNPPSTYNVFGGNDGSGAIMRTNYGQQPFAASNVTYDQATGAVEIAGAVAPYDTRANTDQVWSTSLTTTGAWARGPEEAFKNEGNTNSASANDPGIVTFDISSNPLPIGGGITIVVATNGSPERTVTLNGTEVTGPFDSNWNELALNVGSETELKTLEFSGAVGLGSITVNGRLLVDTGVWNNSQNWSDKVDVTGNQPGQPASTFFNGSISSGGMHAAANQTCVISLTDFPSGSYELYFQRSPNTISGDDLVTVNGSSFLAPNQQWLPVSGSELTQITLENPSRNVMLMAIKLDGTILVDSGAQWNTSQVWSDNVVGAVNPAGAFDGSNTEVAASSASTDIVFTPNLGTGSFEVVVVCNDISSSPNNTVTIDGTGLTAGAGSSSRQFTGTVSSFNTMTISSASGKANFKSVTVDGAILVDPTGGTYNTLFQTWEESKVVTFRAQLAAADVLMTALTQHAQTYNASEDYCEGSVIKAFGELWIAINTAPATTFADLPALMSHPNWERLGITV